MGSARHTGSGFLTIDSTATPASLKSIVGGSRRLCRELVSHLVLEGGRLVVAHAGLTDAYHGRASARVPSFAFYGETTGETDEFGLPMRYPWAEDYRGTATVLYGHAPTPESEVGRQH